MPPPRPARSVTACGTSERAQTCVRRTFRHSATAGDGSSARRPRDHGRRAGERSALLAASGGRDPEGLECRRRRALEQLPQLDVQRFAERDRIRQDDPARAGFNVGHSLPRRAQLVCQILLTEPTAGAGRSHVHDAAHQYLFGWTQGTGADTAGPQPSGRPA